MTTLKPTDNMKKAVAALIAEKRITASAYERAVAQNYTDAYLIKILERNRMIKASIEINGSPARYKAPARPSNPNDPTPERVARSGDVMHATTIGRGAVVPLKRFQVRNLIEQYADKFGMDKRSALARFMQDADYAKRVRCADHNSSGGGSPGDRLGGLGEVPQHVRDGHARHHWMWGRLSPEHQLTGTALVTRELSKEDGTPFSMEDFGAHIFPTVIDKNRRWGAAAGALWALAGELVFLYATCPVRVRRIDESERTLEAVRVLKQ
ncbi:MAG: hypothetical protein HOO99_04085 [Hyphomicrobiaceae bacterium]|nr:hypothetical protein [Hyphomicrobiaceae bacterium]